MNRKDCPPLTEVEIASADFRKRDCSGNNPYVRNKVKI